MLQGSRTTIERSRKLRKEMSPPERMLWRELRKRPGGFKFRPQHPAGPYTADFFCHEARLIVEIDGNAHDFGGRAERDVNRDRWFAERRLNIMRIPAEEVFRNLHGVLTGILSQAEMGTPLHHRAAPGGPPPLEGEDI